MHPEVSRHDRGFTLVETTVVLAILSICVLGFAVLGTRPPHAHAAALVFQGALVDARALAMSNAGISQPGGPASGATISVVQDGGNSTLYVYRSRPIPGTAPLARAPGIPPIHLGATLTLANATSAVQPFSIFISSTGSPSVKADYAYDPETPTSIPTDPGCSEANGVAITFASGATRESHALDCHIAVIDATTQLSDAAVATSNGSLRHR